MRSGITTGFSQRIRLEWMERTAHLVLEGVDRDAIRAELREQLREQLSAGNDPERGNREKAITILLRIWVAPPPAVQPLRNDALCLLRRLPPVDHPALHWGMAMASYPFFGAVADVVGRLLRLQGHAGAAQVQRRVREQFGERETVARAARRVVRSFVDWGVLCDTSDKGVYVAAPSRAIMEAALTAWLVEAALWAGRSEVVALRTLVETPALFPFALKANPADIGLNSRLEWFRQGVAEDMVALKKT